MALTESDTRAQYIDPALAKSGWEGHLVRREFQITAVTRTQYVVFEFVLRSLIMSLIINA